LKSAETFTDIETFLFDFNIEMITSYKNDTVKAIQITLKDDDMKKFDTQNLTENYAIHHENKKDYIWKLNRRLNGPEEEINSTEASYQ
jgi:hypothetical protein